MIGKTRAHYHLANRWVLNNLAVVVTVLLASVTVSAQQAMTVLGPVPADKLGVTLMHEHAAGAMQGWFADLYSQEIHPQNESSPSDGRADQHDTRG